MSSSITVHVKPTAGGDRVTLSVATTSTVGELKVELAARSGIPSASEQRLIYKGQILKDDERTIDSYGITNDAVLHLVKGRPAGGSAQAGGSSSPASTSGGAAAGGAGGFDMPGMPPGMQQAMAAMMEDPAMQSMMSNPEIVRSMMQADPAIRQIMERNPEVAQLFNDPATLREMMRIGTNPALMREHRRTADRAMSNIEALPEGFNALRRMHEQLQEPLMNAATAAQDSTSTSGAGAGGPLAALLAQALGGAGAAMAGTGTSTSGTAAAPNNAPLPNPWAAGGGPEAGAAGAGGGFPAGMGAGFPGLGGMGGMGGMPGMNMNPADALAMLQNPAVQQMMGSVASNPAMIEAMINANPSMRAMADANPQFRAMMSNPEALRAMMDPRNMQQMVQLMQQIEQMRGTNPLFAQMFGNSLGGAGGAPGAMPGMGMGSGAPGFDMASMAALLGGGGAGALGAGGGAPGGLGALFGGMGGGGMGLGAAPPVADPEVAYAAQLQQLVDMGFFDRQQNIAALQATGGNVNAAVERLLGAP